MGRIKAESLESRAERSEKRDSVKVKSEYHEEKTIGSQRGVSRWCFILIAVGLILCIACVGKFSKT